MGPGGVVRCGAVRCGAVRCSFVVGFGGIYGNGVWDSKIGAMAIPLMQRHGALFSHLAAKKMQMAAFCAVGLW